MLGMPHLPITAIRITTNIEGGAGQKVGVSVAVGWGGGDLVREVLDFCSE